MTPLRNEYVALLLAGCSEWTYFTICAQTDNISLYMKLLLVSSIMQMTRNSHQLLPAWHYASAGTRDSPASQKSVFGQIRWTQAGFGTGNFFNLSYTGRIQVTTKTRVLPSGTLSWIPDLENFAMAYQLSQHVINLARQRWMFREW